MRFSHGTSFWGYVLLFYFFAGCKPSQQRQYPIPELELSQIKPQFEMEGNKLFLMKEGEGYTGTLIAINWELGTIEWSALVHNSHISSDSQFIYGVFKKGWSEPSYFGAVDKENGELNWKNNEINPAERNLPIGIYKDQWVILQADSLMYLEAQSGTLLRKRGLDESHPKITPYLYYNERPHIQVAGQHAILYNQYGLVVIDLEKGAIAWDEGMSTSDVVVQTHQLWMHSYRYGFCQRRIADGEVIKRSRGLYGDRNGKTILKDNLAISAAHHKWVTCVFTQSGYRRWGPHKTTLKNLTMQELIKVYQDYPQGQVEMFANDNRVFVGMLGSELVYEYELRTGEFVKLHLLDGELLTEFQVSRGRVVFLTSQGVVMDEFETPFL